MSQTSRVALLVCWLSWIVAGCDDPSSPGSAVDDAAIVDMMSGPDMVSDMASDMASGMASEPDMASNMASDMAPGPDLASDMAPGMASEPDMASGMASDMASEPDMASDMASEPDVAPDIAPDAAAPAIAPCEGDGDCPADAECIAGGCRVMVEWLDESPGALDAREVIAGADADGALRLMTTVGNTAHFLAGAPDDWRSFGSVAIALNNGHQPIQSGRQTTDAVHFGVVTAGYRGVVVDGEGAVLEDRVVDGHAHAFAPDGALWVITSPSQPGGRHPIRLWHQHGAERVVEQVAEDVPIDAHLHLRFTADGQPEALRLVGGVGGLVQRYRPEGEGWSVENVWQRQLAGNPGQGSAFTDADGRVHALLASREGDAIGLYHVIIGDDGVEHERGILGLAVGGGSELVLNTFQMGFDGQLYFLLRRPAGDRERVTRLYRITPDGRTSWDRVDAARLLDGGFEDQALAVAPDGAIYIFTASGDGPLRVRRWGL